MLVDKLPMIESRTNDMTNLDQTDWPEIFERLTEVAHDHFRRSSMHEGGRVTIDGDAWPKVFFDKHGISIIHAALRESIHEEGYDLAKAVCENLRRDGDPGTDKYVSPIDLLLRPTIDLARAYLKAMDEKEPSLKPCPFCGGEAMVERGAYSDWTVYCTNCGVETAERPSEDRAIQAWNQRDYEVL